MKRYTQRLDSLHHVLCVNSEHPMVSAKASVMVYSDIEKKWLPSGLASGISKVCIYHHPVNNTFRVVGRKLQDMEVSETQ